MKRIILMLFLIVGSVFSQTILFEENFNYTAGDLLTSHNWIQSGTSTSNPLTVTSPGLVFSGYPSVAGNACTLNTSGQDVYQTYTPVTSGSVYLSMLINVQSAGTGDYFMALSPSTGQTNYYARLHIKASGTGFLIGISKSNEVTGGASYGNTVLEFNTTYMVVVKHTLVDGAMNDAEQVFVFSSSIPAEEPTASEVGPYVETTKNDPTDLGMVTIRQGSTSAGVSPALIIDGIRVVTAWSDLLPATIEAPVAISATNITSTGFTANWNNTSGAVKYFLDVSVDSNFSSLVTGYSAKDVDTSTSFNVSGLSSNTIYYYRVSASNGTGVSPKSNVISVVTKIGAPVAVKATDITSTGFAAVWNKSQGATNYWLDVSTDSVFSSFVDGFNNKEVGDASTYEVLSLNPLAKYYYRVRASNETETSENSNTVAVELGIFETPTVLKATNVTSTGFTANWDKVAIATSYVLDISTMPDFSTFVDGYNSKDVGNVSSFNVTSLKSNTVYYYRIHASNNKGTSIGSDSVMVTTLIAAPVAKEATNIASTGFTVNWNASEGATNYWIDISTTDDFSNILADYNNKPVGNVTTFSITSLTPNTTYYFRVCASSDNGTSPYSQTITIVTKITAVDNLTSIPTKFDLGQNYPNPFNPTTTIDYQIPQNAFVNIKVYNVIGSEVATLVNAMRAPGYYQVRFDASRLTSGIYIYRIQAGNFVGTKKMILVK